MSDSTCQPHHDWFTALLTFGLCCGLVASYLPQHYRIISKGSSEGFSPWFLLLGTTSAGSGMWNLITMQWGIIRCCRVFSVGSCVEMTAGVTLVFLQWLMFSMVFVLYMLYYPPHLKYDQKSPDTDDSSDSELTKDEPVKSEEWALSIKLAWVVVFHFAFLLITTFYLLLTEASFPGPDAPLSPVITSWATFLGVSSALLSAIQYTPQLVHTYKMKLVGALSIPMMCIQSPGAVLMVSSIALRPGTNWTSWITFAVAGVMQGSLLMMCICWKIRQRRLGIDDFGNVVETGPLIIISSPTTDGNGTPANNEGRRDLDSAARAVALGSVPPLVEAPSASETTPLLVGRGGEQRDTANTSEFSGWFKWLRSG
ncbi:hypothetical protein AX16_006798 [Volvariella volvacea WC 439]|nr:hypothetical protein AX16_006798 [Volvariella volvacea WC 439]